MKFRLNSLVLALRKSVTTIRFADLSYFWGQMGAGKTSIARLFDYCLGGDIQLSPALQSEFVAATLNLTLERGDLELERSRDADMMIASWGSGDDRYQVVIPAHHAAGEVMPGTGVENLSDLVFWLSGLTPPRVRRSKLKPDSETGRLSVRDLLWYCYLDQDEIDSSFFHLDEDANPFKRLKSRDVLRFVIGFHNERIAELEAELDRLRGEKQGLLATIAGINSALKEMDVESEQQIARRSEALLARVAVIDRELDTLRRQTSARHSKHAADELLTAARRLGEEIGVLDAAIEDVIRTRDRDQRYLNEIETLSVKFRRSMSARVILSGVTFESCPRCAQGLPHREPGRCPVCGQTEAIIDVNSTESDYIDRDVKARASELTDIIAHHNEKLESLRRDRRTAEEQKARIEYQRNEASRRYDSAYLSVALAKERERASLLQEATNLSALVRLPQMLGKQYERLGELEGKERAVRAELKVAREAAESDDTNLDHLKGYFLDCLVRAGVPGITSRDKVTIPTTSFLPEVYGPKFGDTAVTSFATISSGGKKTLFKCCFAIAVHRLAAKVASPLPEILIIDSPMKNISERENRSNFESFYGMVYELKATELAKTQITLIDKEYFPPPKKVRFAVESRHMRPNDDQNPPLIPYYRGK